MNMNFEKKEEIEYEMTFFFAWEIPLEIHEELWKWGLLGRDVLEKSRLVAMHLDACSKLPLVVIIYRECSDKALIVF